MSTSEPIFYNLAFSTGIQTGQVYEPPPPPPEGSVALSPREGVPETTQGVISEASLKSLPLWPENDNSSRQVFFILREGGLEFVAFGVLRSSRMPFVARGTVGEQLNLLKKQVELDGATVEICDQASLQRLMDYLSAYFSEASSSSPVDDPLQAVSAMWASASTEVIEFHL